MKTRFPLPLLPLILLAGTISSDAQTVVTLHNFSPLTTLTNVQGSFPAATLVRSGNTLYGTTPSGGTSFQGTIFKINADGTGYLGLYSFTGGNDGGGPAGSLLLVGNTLYGTAQNGGASNNGVVFAIQTDGSGFTNLYSFTGGNDGAHPTCSLVLSGNKLYGTTQNGGPAQSGNVFAVSTNGQNFSGVYNFTGGDDGALPLAGLVLSNGTLFGTTSQSGSNFYGTVFSFTIAGSVFSNIYDFSGFADGSSPSANLLLSGNTLYGTTSSGGSSFSGTVFAVHTDGSSFTNLHFFTGGDDGSDPVAALALNGNLLYGTSESGGAFGNGNVFAVNINGSGFTNLHSFSQKDTNFDNSDGANPAAGLVLVGNTLFGTASSGGLNYGTIFAMDVSGAPFTTLLPFYPYSSGLTYQANNDGARPVGTMAISGGTLYGEAESGGVWGYGTVFSTLTNGSNFTTLYNFRGENDGSIPVGGVVLSNGIIYGAARNGGNFQAGLLYSVPTNGGSANVVYAFSSLDFQFHNSDGAQPVGDLSLSGSRIYGATSTGGTSGKGTLFAVNTDGTVFTNLHNFTATDTNGFNTDGATPNGGLLLASNIIYGTAQNGGSNGFGTVFSVHTDGSSFTTLYSFAGSNDGANPMAGLFLTNNILYGSAANGGANNSGTLFTININGTGFSNFYTFNGFADGANPQSRLVGDLLYQITPNGGTSFDGSILQIGADGSNPISLSFQNANGGQLSGPPVFNGYFIYAVASFGGSAGNGTLWTVSDQFPSQNIFLTPASGPATTIASGGTFSGFFPLNTTVNFQVTTGQTYPGTNPVSMQLAGGSLAPGLNLIQDGTGAWRISGTVNTVGNFSSRLAVLEYPFVANQLGFDTGICLAPAVQNVFPVNGLSSQVNPGDHVLINGSALSGTTWVLFGYFNGTGTPATGVSVVNDSQLNVTVPTGAKSGRIKVDTGCGFTVSDRPLIIGPPPSIPISSPQKASNAFTFKITENPNIPPELRGGLIVIQESTDLKTWTNKQTNEIPTNSNEEEFSIPFPFGGLVVPKDFYRAYIESFNSPLPLPH